MALTDGLEAFYEFESGAATTDAHGSNDLTDNNTVANVSGHVGNAADFTRANSEFFNIAHNSSLNVAGNTSFTWAGWVNLKNTSNDQTLVVKLNLSDGEYRLDFRFASQRFRFVCYGSSGFGSAAGVDASSFGAPSTDTWYFIVARHDATNDTISIQVNNGTEDSTAFAAGIFSGTADVYLGGDSQLGQYGDLRLDQWGFWKGRVLTSDEGTELYNGGAGLSYADILAGGGGDETIWNFTELTAPAVVDLLAIVDDPSGTPATKKLAISDLIATLLVSNVVVQVKTVGSGTYTPTSGMKKVLGIAVGAGGGGAGGLNTDSAGGGGGGGGTVIRLMTAAEIGVSKAYVVGAGGAATSNGTATILDAAGALMNAGGGQAGTAGATFSVIGVSVAGGAGGTAANGQLNIPGRAGDRGFIFSGSDGLGGRGGRSAFGFGAAPGGTNVAGGNGTAYGGGGAGGHASATADRAGGSGADGILFMLEFLAA